MKISAVIALVCTFLLLLQTSGRWLVFKWSEWEIKKEVAQHIRQQPPPDRLVVISVLKTEKQHLEWMEPHEFRHQGMMYDIVREETKGDSLYYYCLADPKEATLLAQWEQSMQEQGPLSSAPGQWLRLLQLLSGQYILDMLVLLYPFTELAPQAVFHYGFSLQPWQLAPLPPPPRARPVFAPLL